MNDSAGSDGGHGAQGDPATPVLRLSPGLETAAPSPALVVRQSKSVDRPRIGGILPHRLERFREAVEKQLLQDAGDVAMARHSFKDDLELSTARHAGKYLSARQKKIAREWEKPKKEVPMALLAANERVINAMRAQQAQPAVTLNVERAVIRMPDTKPEREEDAIVIDVEATLAPG